MAGLKGQVSMKFCAFIVNSRLSLVNPQETARLLRLIISSDQPFPLWESYGAPHARLCTTRPRTEIHRHIDRCLRHTDLLTETTSRQREVVVAIPGHDEHKARGFDQ